MSPGENCETAELSASVHQKVGSTAQCIQAVALLIIVGVCVCARGGGLLGGIQGTLGSKHTAGVGAGVGEQHFSWRLQVRICFSQVPAAPTVASASLPGASFPSLPKG